MDTVLFIQSPAKTSALDKLDGVRGIAAAAGWHVQEIDGIPSKKVLRDLIAFWKPVGAILECGGGFHEIPADRFDGLPAVYLDRNPRTLPPDASCVSHDSYATGRLAAKELLQTGYAHFAFVPHPRPSFWNEDRARGFQDALALNGRTAAVFAAPAGGGRFGPAHQRALRAWLRTLPRPCGLLAANDYTAAEVLAAAANLGLRVPDDLAVVGVDNFAPICENTSPPLTSIRPDFRRAGELAARTLQELVAARAARGGRARPVRRLTFGPADVVRRASSRVFRRSDPQVAAAVELIRRRACDGLAARDVFALFTCSRRTAEMRFRAATGRSVLSEIQAVRLARAQDLLRNPRQGLDALAQFCGYRSVNALRKMFRAETGLPFTAWRRFRK